MILETITTEGLAQLSYLIGDDRAGVCAVIDPRRDVEVYLTLAARHGLKIDFILETHIHADFVSGSLELSAITGAPIGVGAAGQYGFRHLPLDDGQVLALGGLELRVLHTPGHTPEHICFLVSGGSGAREPWGLFSGDTLFAGEVGRPDLLGEGTEEGLARSLYRSLREKILDLSSGIVVYPGHGQGSPCGGSIGDRNVTTLGYERLYNPRLQPAGEMAFVSTVLSSLPPAPRYYRKMKRINAAGPPLLNGIPCVPPLDFARFEREMARDDTIVLDAREIDAFCAAHIPGALNIALRDEFPQWAGWMLGEEPRLLLVAADPAHIDRIVRHLIRIGYDNIAGWLRNGMRHWCESGRRFEQTRLVSVHEVSAMLADQTIQPQLIDVRRDDEWNEGHIPSAEHIFAPELEQRIDELSRDRPIVVTCGSGYRAGVAGSVLKRCGFENVSVVAGSMAAWRGCGFPVEIPTVREGSRRTASPRRATYD